MASLLILLDDIATVLDDVAVLTKLTAKKAAGVLGDDLALNAQQVSGVVAKRELPVVWAVAKGSFRNKLILVPVALLLNAFLPWLVTPLLMLGGAFLCYEGAEKVLHHLLSKKQPHAAGEGGHSALEQAALSSEQLLAFEAEKIKGAIKTDFILSAEIIVITLGVVKDADFWSQLGTLGLVAIIMTIGVYALVGGIIKLDDLGFYLSKRSSALAQRLGRGIVYMAPWLMKALSVVGTAAMFLVGGEIISHGLPFLHHAAEWAKGTLGGLLGNLIFSALVGLLSGLLLVAVMGAGRRLTGRQAAH